MYKGEKAIKTMDFEFNYFVYLLKILEFLNIAVFS